MDLCLYTALSEFNGAQTKGRHVVVIDVLRASSTIVHACENGVERIIPVAEVEDATRLLPTLDRKKTLLGGEREGKKIDGFDLGNSPLEYPSKVVKGKTLILATTNGTVAMTKCASADRTIVGCFLNLGAVVTHLASERAKRVSILCAGKLGHMSLEDVVCGGLLVDRLTKETRGRPKLSDGATAARALAGCMADIGQVVRDSSHGRYLAELGFDKDLEFCSSVDKYSTVPVVVDGRISGQEALRR